MQCIAGVDISKSHLDICCDGQSIRRFQASEQLEVVAFLQDQGVDLVIFEATGGLERPLMLSLQDARIEYRCINPRRIRQFAQSAGLLAKTDALDALIIHQYGVTMEPPARLQRDRRMIELDELLARRDQLMTMCSAERTRRGQAESPEIQASIDAVVKLLRVQIRSIEKQLDARLAEDERQVGLGRALSAVFGVGEQLVRSLLIRVPELGLLDRSAISALVGVAPMNNDSGSFRGVRRIKGGRPAVRRVLYMATTVAVRRDGELKSFYDGLRTRGKPFKVAIVACMRKLLIHLNSIARAYYFDSRSPAVSVASPPR